MPCSSEPHRFRNILPESLTPNVAHFADCAVSLRSLDGCRHDIDAGQAVLHQALQSLINGRSVAAGAQLFELRELSSRRARIHPEHLRLRRFLDEELVHANDDLFLLLDSALLEISAGGELTLK